MGEDARSPRGLPQARRAAPGHRASRWPMARPHAPSRGVRPTPRAARNTMCRATIMVRPCRWGPAQIDPVGPCEGDADSQQLHQEQRKREYLGTQGNDRADPLSVDIAPLCTRAVTPAGLGRSSADRSTESIADVGYGRFRPTLSTIAMTRPKRARANLTKNTSLCGQVMLHIFGTYAQSQSLRI